MKFHSEALVEGMHSVALNQLTLLNENLYNRKYKKLDKIKKLDLNKKALFSRMMLSYFNIGVQQEHLKRHTDCEVSYNRSRSLASMIGDKDILKRLSKSANKESNKNSHYNSFNHNSSLNSKVNNNNSQNSIFQTFDLSELKYKYLNLNNFPYFIYNFFIE